MATLHSRSAARLMMAPAVFLLLVWMLVPLTMTLYFSFKRYLPLRGGDRDGSGSRTTPASSPRARSGRACRPRSSSSVACS